MVMADILVCHMDQNVASKLGRFGALGGSVRLFLSHTYVGRKGEVIIEDLPNPKHHHQQFLGSLVSQTADSNSSKPPGMPELMLKLNREDKEMSNKRFLQCQGVECQNKIKQEHLLL